MRHFACALVPVLIIGGSAFPPQAARTPGAAATFMWARGLEDRPITLLLEPPSGVRWTVATQLHLNGNLTAPNLQYFMDSPVEFGPISMREFTTSGHRFRFAMHHTGTDSELD